MKVSSIQTTDFLFLSCKLKYNCFCFNFFLAFESCLLKKLMNKKIFALPTPWIQHPTKCELLKYGKKSQGVKLNPLTALNMLNHSEYNN